MTVQEAYALLLPAVFEYGAEMSIDNDGLIISKEGMAFGITPLSIKDESFVPRLRDQFDALDETVKTLKPPHSDFTDWLRKGE